MGDVNDTPGTDTGSEYRRNYGLGIANGALFMGGSSFIEPITVLPGFIVTFTKSAFLVGLAGSLHQMGWSLPQLLISNRVERLRYKMPFYMICNVIRMALYFAVVPLVFFLGSTHPQAVLVGFFLLFGMGALLGGGSGLTFTDIVGRMLPAQKIGRFYATRFFLGAGAMGILAGYCVHFILGRQGQFPFPRNYTVIFSCAFVLMAAGIVAFFLVRERPAATVSRAQPLARTLAGIPALLRSDPNFARMLLSRLLLAGRGLSVALYTLMALKVFELPPATVGTFVMVKQGTGMLGNIWWARLSERVGNRAVIRTAAVGQLALAAYAVALAWLADPLMRIIPGTLGRTGLFVPIFALLGLTMFGDVIGYTSFAINIAPEGRRPTYIGLMNTTMGVAGLLPALGGALADLFTPPPGWSHNFQLVFALTLIMSTGGVVLTNTLRDAGNERPL